MIAHEETRIPFEIGGERFVAMGFLRTGEASCALEDALHRLRSKSPVANSEDWLRLHAWRRSLPAELHGYRLATARCENPRGALRYLVLGEHDEEWQQFSMHYARVCDEKYLIVCRAE
jgi:hypothetical protein